MSDDAAHPQRGVDVVGVDHDTAVQEVAKLAVERPVRADRLELGVVAAEQVPFEPGMALEADGGPEGKVGDGVRGVRGGGADVGACPAGANTRAFPPGTALTGFGSICYSAKLETAHDRVTSSYDAAVTRCCAPAEPATVAIRPPKSERIALRWIGYLVSARQLPQGRGAEGFPARSASFSVAGRALST